MSKKWLSAIFYPSAIRDRRKRRQEQGARARAREHGDEAVSAPIALAMTNRNCSMLDAQWPSARLELGFIERAKKRSKSRIKEQEHERRRSDVRPLISDSGGFLFGIEEALQMADTCRVPKLSQRFGLNLTDAFARYV